MNKETPVLAENRFDLMNCKCCFFSMSKIGIQPSLTLFYDYLRDGAYELSCEKGHKTIVCLQNFPFEIHFEIGALALIDGYYAESVFAFAKALERFYEFCIKLFILEDSLPNGFEKAWNAVKNNSERQFGAFLFLYLKRFKEAPVIFPDQKFNSSKTSCSAFRNDVIHKGYLPSKDEAFKYGKMIFEYIRELIVKLQKEDKDKLLQLTSLHLENLGNKNKAVNPTTMSIGAVLSLSRGDIEEISFEKELENLKQKNKIQHSSQEQRERALKAIKLSKP